MAITIYTARTVEALVWPELERCYCALTQVQPVIGPRSRHCGAKCNHAGVSIRRK
jgi:hypothetical protein